MSHIMILKNIKHKLIVELENLISEEKSSIKKKKAMKVMGQNAVFSKKGQIQKRGQIQREIKFKRGQIQAVQNVTNVNIHLTY